MGMKMIVTGRTRLVLGVLAVMLAATGCSRFGQADGDELEEFVDTVAGDPNEEFEEEIDPVLNSSSSGLNSSSSSLNIDSIPEVPFEGVIEDFHAHDLGHGLVHVRLAITHAGGAPALVTPHSATLKTSGSTNLEANAWKYMILEGVDDALDTLVLTSVGLVDSSDVAVFVNAPPAASRERRDWISLNGLEFSLEGSGIDLELPLVVQKGGESTVKQVARASATIAANPAANCTWLLIQTTLDNIQTEIDTTLPSVSWSTAAQAAATDNAVCLAEDVELRKAPDYLQDAGSGVVKMLAMPMDARGLPSGNPAFVEADNDAEVDPFSDAFAFRVPMPESTSVVNGLTYGWKK